MPVAVFDIDGTLTDTFDVDVECYEEAMRDELGLDIPSDWPTFDEVTDAAILRTACERLGRPVPDEETQDRIARRIAALLEEVLEREPERFRAIPGAPDIFGVLKDLGWNVAMATGAWRASALVKLRGAGIPHHDVPLASSSDYPARAEIIRHAVRGLSAEGSGPFVYIGDGVWDGRASLSLSYSFIGVATGSRGARLKEVGAIAVVPDFQDPTILAGHLQRLANGTS
jgi:phosphoglycolate phosphatase-like HAD superfamily hydrolase